MILPIPMLWPMTLTSLSLPLFSMLQPFNPMARMEKLLTLTHPLLKTPAWALLQRLTLHLYWSDLAGIKTLLTATKAASLTLVMATHLET